jgi:hypothetical protein
MSTETKPVKRVTYSLHPDRASELARHALDMKDELQRTVNRQDILDVLVHLMATDDSVRNKVVRAIKKL